MKKWLWIFGVVIVLIGIMVASYRPPKQSSSSTQSMSEMMAVSSDDSSSTSSSELTTAEEDAKNAMENPDKELIGEEKTFVKKILDVAIPYAENLTKDGAYNLSYSEKYAHNLASTSNEGLYGYTTYVSAGYRYDDSTIKVYQSNNDNVYQFTVHLKKDGADDLVMTGNVSTGAKQVEISNIQGVPTGMAN